MNLNKFCRSVAIFRNIMVMAIGLFVVGTTYGQSVVWMRSSSGGDKLKTQALTFAPTGTAPAVSITVSPGDQVSDHGGIRRFFHRCRRLVFELP